MSVQMSYGYSTPIGAPGGIVYLAPHLIDTFINEEKTGVMKFGLGVVNGSKPGAKVKLPTDESTAIDFAGITVNNRHTEHDLDGNIRIPENRAIGVMRYGRIYGRVEDGVEINYGDPVYLIVDGDNAGFFTNDEDEGVAIKARFLSGADSSTKVAVIELFNQAQEPAREPAKGEDDEIGGIENG